MPQKITLFNLLLIFSFFLSSLSYANSKEERLGILDLGSNTGLVNTELFPNASRAEQALAIAQYNGKTSLFITVRVGHAHDKDHGQNCRIVQFDEETPGHFSTHPKAISEVLPIGHGQGLGVLYQNKEIYFVSMSAYTDNPKARYKGVSLIHWHGSATNANDVREIRLLSDSSPYSDLTPTISSDGKYLIALARAPQKKHVCLIWPIACLTTPCKPIRIFTLENDMSHGNSWQGLCADTQAIYFIHGGTYAAKRHTLAAYTYTGRRFFETLLFNEKRIYKQKDGIARYEKGIPWNIELEGIALYKKYLYYVGLCTLYPYGDIVRYKGANYACIHNTDGTQFPENHAYFMRTELSANTDYMLGRKYRNGVPQGQKFFKKYKYLYRIPLVPF